MESCERKNPARFIKNGMKKKAAETEKEEKDSCKKGSEQDRARREAKKTLATLWKKVKIR